MPDFNGNSQLFHSRQIQLFVTNLLQAHVLNPVIILAQNFKSFFKNNYGR
jgi:hypothetical protein